MNDFDWELFDRYLAGSATPAERQKFEQWLAGDPEREPLVRAFQAALQNLEGDVTEEEVEALWQGVAQRTGASRKKRSGWIVGAGVAAAALAVVASTIVVMQQGESQQIVGVPRGQVRHLVLPDSTEVILGGGSTLKHPERFGRDSREVTLEGEGSFRVHHPGGLPFRVYAGDLVATDLGTEFMVQAFPEVAGAQVVVRTGLVAVQPRDEGASSTRDLRPGELGRIGRDGSLEIEQVDTAAYFAWTAGTLVFDNTPLREALPRLARWYDLDFRLADSALGDIPISGRLDRAISPSRLDLFAASIGLEQTTQGRSVTFFRRQ